MKLTCSVDAAFPVWKS